MKFIKKFLLLALLLIATGLSACGASLHATPLSFALVNEAYSFKLDVGYDGWDWWDSPDLYVAQVGGELPNGVEITSDGYVYGTPTEVGNFNFKARVYASTNSVDDIWESWDGCDCSSSDSSSDSEWLTLFVTEPSTNADCPLPNDETTTETYVCLGLPEVTSLATDEGFILDVNYFVNFDQAKSDAIDVVDFTIYYDSTLFVIDENTLNSQILRETATRTNNATVEFDNTIPGELRVIVTAGDYNFHASGRFLDLPIYALTDIPAGEYFFDIAINDISSANGTALPSNVAIWGSILVDEDVVVADLVE